MTSISRPIFSATRPVRPDLVEAIGRLTPGQRLRITQTIRVGQKQWDAVVTGTFRKLNYLVTGLATERVSADDIVVPTVHFTKDNGELSSVTLDERTVIEGL